MQRKSMPCSTNWVPGVPILDSAWCAHRDRVGERSSGAKFEGAQPVSVSSRRGTLHLSCSFFTMPAVVETIPVAGDIEIEELDGVMEGEKEAAGKFERVKSEVETDVLVKDIIQSVNESTFRQHDAGEDGGQRGISMPNVNGNEDASAHRRSEENSETGQNQESRSSEDTDRGQGSTGSKDSARQRAVEEPAQRKSWLARSGSSFSLRSQFLARHGMSQRTIMNVRGFLIQRKDIEIGQRIGEGACGEVFQAKVRNEDAAVKTIHS
eukprot:3924338-Rhodomonas_salina.2